MKDFIISILLIVALYFGFNYYFNNSNSSTTTTTTITHTDTIKIPTIRNRIITKTIIDTIYRKQIDSIFIYTINKDSLFEFVASPFDTTLIIDTIATLGIKYFPLNRELLTELKLNPIKIESKETIIKESLNNKIEYILISLTTGIIVGLLVGQ